MKITRYAIKVIGEGFLFQNICCDEYGDNILSTLTIGPAFNENSKRIIPFLCESIEAAQKIITEKPSSYEESSEYSPYFFDIELEDVEIVEVVLDFKI